MNTQENKLIDLKFETMNKNMDRIERTIKEGFNGVHKKIDEQEKKFITKDQHKIVIKDVTLIKSVLGSAGGLTLAWIIGRFFNLL